MIGQRIKEIRKYEGLTLEKFGERLGVTKTAVSRLERGINGVTEQMTLSVCREFGVNEEWLRTGKGEMFRRLSRGEVIADFMADVLNDTDSSFRVRLVSALARLNDKDWEMLAQVIDKLAEEYKKEGE